MAEARSLLKSFFSLRGRPDIRAALTSCTVMAVSDVVCQSVVEAKNKKKVSKAKTTGPKRSTSDEALEDLSPIHESTTAIDANRSARFALVGLTLHGPFFYYGFRWIDAHFGPATNISTALVKSFVGQVTLFPVYLATFLVYMAFLEGKSVAQTEDRVRSVFWPAYVTGGAFWPAANIVNFMLVPPQGRVAYVAGAGLIWNTYLSWANSSLGRPLDKGK